MSIQSMTGFGRGECEGENFSLTVEIKTVNHRFKDIKFKMSSVFNSEEISLKKIIEKEFNRGTFDVYVNYKKNQKKAEELELDYNKIKNFISKMKEVSEAQKVQMNFAPTDFMRSDFYVEDEDRDEELKSLLRPAFDQAIESLKASREEEGQKLIEKLRTHKEEYNSFYQKVMILKEGYQEKVKEKLLSRFENLNTELGIDEPRFLQEVIYYLEKLDIDEEINRIAIHLEKLDKLMATKGEVGRQIDFLMQELNRETNTIGSKSGNSEISESVVQMKVRLEKIREQGLNLQ